MIIYDIPKAFRASVKVDFIHKFCFIRSEIFYISLRDGDNEKEFYCMPSGYFTIDLLKLKEYCKDYENLRVVLIYDTRIGCTVDYSEYDTSLYKVLDFIKEA